MGKSLISALNANVAAGRTAATLYFKKPRDVVILTPTGPDSSTWVRDVVTRLRSGPIKPRGVPVDLGPFNIVWESTIEHEKTGLLTRLGDQAEDATLNGLRMACDGDHGVLGDLVSWAEHRFRIKGQTEFRAAELRAAIERILLLRRAYSHTALFGQIRAMTINQAKNQEFEGVVVLWPFAVGGNQESQRRRLYNALTRAQKWAVVIMQDTPANSRLAKPPFSTPPAM